MRIDLMELKKTHWFEDAEGNEIPRNEVDRTIKKGNRTIMYYSCFPLQVHKYISEYSYHPTNPIIKFLCRKSKRFYDWISVGKNRTFHEIADFTATYGSGQDVIVAMVNSGDYTLEEAIWIYANSCERCMNALAYKYLDGKDGYPEFSDEWKKCNTHCSFCADENGNDFPEE